MMQCKQHSTFCITSDGRALKCVNPARRNHTSVHKKNNPVCEASHEFPEGSRSTLNKPPQNKKNTPYSQKHSVENHHFIAREIHSDLSFQEKPFIMCTFKGLNSRFSVLEAKYIKYTIMLIRMLFSRLKIIVRKWLVCYHLHRKIIRENSKQKQ